MDDLLNLSLLELRSRMARHELSSTELVSFYLRRVAAYDKTGPRLNALRTLNLNLLCEAEALDREERCDGTIRGPLHGIPILIKDNIDVIGMPTTAGSTALRDHYPSQDAPLVSALKESGALIMGKANMTEWANYMTRDMPGGYSALGGQVRNPFGPETLSPGGSSSGSGAAVGAGLVPVAIGTETSGSILSPAQAAGVFGLKPTLGLISRRGIIPIAASQDTAGPLAKCVADLALMLEVLAVSDPLDGATNGSYSVNKKYLQALESASLEGVRLGVVRQPLEKMSEEQRKAFGVALEEMQDLGAVLIEVELPGMAGQQDWRSKVLLYEFKPALNAYLKGLASHLPVHSLRELLVYNSAHATEELRYGQSLIQEAELLSGTLTEPEYIEHRFQDLLQSRQQGIDYALNESGAEA
ncbi:MAG: amidase family protein, partial [Symbiobacteriaceae bacterium]|nr:amidase family protein [Symbiobacteriaceae bacterium]